MARVLFIDGCVREESSRTLELAAAYLDAWRRFRPQDGIETVRLNELRLRPYDAQTMRALAALGQNWDAPQYAFARQFRDADHLIIAAPFWNGTFPAALHTYLEHICVAGLTFVYEENAYKGFCRAHECVFLTTRGGFYETGKPQLSEIAAPFLRSLLTMQGVDRLHVVAAEGLDVEGQDAQAILARAKEKAHALAETLTAQSLPNID